MKVSNLKIRPNNPRRISPAALEKLKESIQRDPEYMVLRPIITDEDMVCLGGNQRLLAIQELGMEEIPNNWVVKASNLSEEKKKRFILVDNSPEGMSGDWDYVILNEDYSDMPLIDWGIIPDLEKIDPIKEWEGMPEFDNDNIKVFKTLKVHFNNKNDMIEFSKLLNQDITENTKYIYYPEQIKEKQQDKEYE